MERGGRGLGHRAEREACNHAEAKRACAAQRPEQILVALLVALHHAPVGQHHLGRDQLVRRQPPATAQQAEPAAERLAADPDRGAAAGRDRDFVPGQGGVEVAEPEAGPHGRRTVRDLEGIHRPEVQDHPGARRAPSEVVASAPHRDRDTRAAREGERLGHVLGRPAQHDGLRGASWKRGIWGLRTSSYRGEPGRTTSPSIAAVRSRKAVSTVAMSRWLISSPLWTVPAALRASWAERARPGCPLDPR